jgi:hypothetical protein
MLLIVAMTRLTQRQAAASQSAKKRKSRRVTEGLLDVQYTAGRPIYCIVAAAPISRLATNRFAKHSLESALW